MDEVAERVRAVPTLAGRTHAWPIANVSAPMAVVGYPSDYTFDATYGRGVDTMTGSLVVFVGRPTDRSSRDNLAGYVAGGGPESIKAAVDGDDYTSCDGVRVASVEFDVYPVGGVEYLTAVFSLDIAGPGTA